MKPHKPQPGEPRLFDLPLEPQGETEKAAPPSRPRPSPPRAVEPAGPLPLFAEEEAGLPASPKPRRAESAAVTDLPARGAEPEREVPAAAVYPPASVGSRLLAALADLGLHAVVLGLAVGGSALLGIRPERLPPLPLALFLFAFSFLYTVVPLAFWGQTPGMTWRGILARGGGSEPLTFTQTFLRWLGTLLTIGGLGLPLLLVFAGGRSLADRLSGTETVLLPFAD